MKHNVFNRVGESTQLLKQTTSWLSYKYPYAIPIVERCSSFVGESYVSRAEEGEGMVRGAESQMKLLRTSYESHKNHIRFIATFLLLFCLGTGSAWGADETITFSEQNYDNAAEISSVSGTNFSITFDKGTNNNAPKYYTSGTAIRAYGGNTMTISSTTKTISKIEFTFGSSDGSNEITADVDTYSNGTWTGSATSIVFTIEGTSGNRRLSAVAVTYEATNPTYTITATSSNVAHGTVSVSGSTITATPTSGYRVKSGTEGYTVTTGTATVTNNGDNTFTVSASSNCTVQINFEAIPTYTINYHDGSGNGTKTNVYEGTNLIETLGTPAASCDATSTTFMGWSTTEIKTKTNTVPTYISASAVVNSTTAAVTYYAVYAQETAGSSTFSKYEKLTSNPTDWTEFKYVLATADNGYVLTGKSASGNYGAYATMSTTTEQTTYEITVETTATSGRYKLKQNGKYISCTSTGSLDWVDSYTAANGTTINNCDWAFYNQQVEIPFQISDKWYYILYKTSSTKQFNTYYKGNGYDAVYLYKKVMTTGPTTYTNYITTCCESLGQINGSNKLYHTKNRILVYKTLKQCKLVKSVRGELTTSCSLLEEDEEIQSMRELYLI